MSKGTAKGSPDGPRFIYGKENVNWGGPKRASKSSNAMKNFKNDFSANENETEIIENCNDLLSEWGVDAPHGEVIKDFDAFKKNFDENIEQIQEQMDSCIDSENPEEILQFAQDIVNSQEYQNIVATKENGRQKREQYEKEYQEATSQFKKFIDNGRQSYKTRKGEVNVTEKDASQIYTICQNALQAHDEYKGYSLLADDYKNIITQGLSSSSQILEGTDRIIEFKGENIGNMVAVADTDPGSREWHEARQLGLGGSDIGKIASKYKKKFNNDGSFELYEDPYFKDGLKKIWDSKLEPITEDQIVDQENMTDFTDAASRGHGQEEIIGYMASLALGERVMKSKKTWSRPGSSINMNYDLFLTSDGVNPDGNLEIKTATDPTKWGNEEDGIDGIPTEYRAQVLAGCYEAGFERGAVASLINETELRVYEFDMTDDLKEEAENNKKQADKIYEAVEEARKTGDTQFNIEDFGVQKKRPGYSAGRTKGFGKTMLTPPKRISKNGGLGATREKFFQKIADLRSSGKEELYKEFIDSMPNDISTWEPEDMKRGLQSLYVRSGRSLKENGQLGGIDLECTSLSATRGHIIDVGLTAIDMNNGRFTGETIDKLYDVPTIAKYHNGTGEVDVHNITLKDIEGKEQFNNSDNHKQIIDAIINNGGTLCAHNAAYEKRFLRGHVKGFAEAELRGDIRFVDTMDVINYTMDNAPDNTMESFTTRNGVSYENAHRALPDTKMMLSSIYNYYNGSYGGEENLSELS